jgi:hypothetical protein
VIPIGGEVESPLSNLRLEEGDLGAGIFTSELTAQVVPSTIKKTSLTCSDQSAIDAIDGTERFLMQGFYWLGQ